jgi:hypothetical protein
MDYCKLKLMPKKHHSKHWICIHVCTFSKEKKIKGGTNGDRQTYNVIAMSYFIIL